MAVPTSTPNDQESQGHSSVVETQTSLDFSDALPKLIRDDKDLEGHLAYALYKKQKQQFIQANNLKRNDPRVMNYHFDLQEYRIDGLRALAEAKLIEYADAVQEAMLESDRNQAVKDAVISNIITTIQNESDNTRKVVRRNTLWWKSVLIGVASSFVFGLVLTAARVIDWSNPFTGNAATPQISESNKTGSK